MSQYYGHDSKFSHLGSAWLHLGRPATFKITLSKINILLADELLLRQFLEISRKILPKKSMRGKQGIRIDPLHMRRWGIYILVGRKKGRFCRSATIF
jgi:hypothetical protein